MALAARVASVSSAAASSVRPTACGDDAWYSSQISHTRAGGSLSRSGSFVTSASERGPGKEKLSSRRAPAAEMPAAAQEAAPGGAGVGCATAAGSARALESPQDDLPARANERAIMFSSAPTPQ